MVLKLFYYGLLNVNFENPIIELHVFYVFNMHVKFHSNWMLFTLRSKNLFLVHIFYHKNLKFKHFINDRTINL